MKFSNVFTSVHSPNPCKIGEGDDSKRSRGLPSAIFCQDRQPRWSAPEQKASFRSVPSRFGFGSRRV